MVGKYLYRYPGTRPFEDTDSDRKLFFGRERETDELLQQIIARKLVVLHAESGLGKTSLLNAGVSALLRQRDFLPIKVRFNMAGISPIHAVYVGIILTEALQCLDIEPGENESLWHYFKTAAFWSPDDSLLTPVLIFDQFEEFFAFHGPDSRGEFIQQLADLVHNTLPRALRQAIRAGEPYRYGEEPPRVKIMISIRSDFVGQLDELSSAIPEILENRFRLSALTRKQAREAITGPAQIQDEQIFTPSFRYSEEALNTMLDYLSKRRERGGVINKDEVESFQLQLLCRHIETNLREKAGKTASQEEWEVKKEDLGGEAGMDKVFKYFYENQLAGLKPVLQKRRVRRLCEKGLISTSNRRLSLEEEVIETQFKVSPALLAQLVDNRLLRAEKRVGSVYYELSHDSLITPIRLSQRKHRATLENFAILILVLISIGFMSILTISDLMQNKLSSQFKEAEQFVFTSNPGKAIEIYYKILEADPKNIMAIMKLGELLYEVKKYEDAVQLYKKAIVGRIMDIRVYTGLLKILSETGKEEEAINYLNQAITRNPKQTEVYEALGGHYADKKEFKMAIENYEIALAIKNKSQRVYEKLAVLYVKKGEKEKAIDIFKRALKVDVKLVGIYQEIRDVLKQTNDTGALETLLGIAMQVKIKDADHYFGLGNDYYDLEKYDTAIINYRKALELKPNYVDASFLIAIAQYKKKGDYNDMPERFQKSLELKPDLALYHYHMGYSLSVRGYYYAAISSYQKALELRPDLAVTKCNMAIEYKVKIGYDVVIASYQNVLKLKPGEAGAFNNMGYLFIKTGDFNSAIECYQKALELKPDYAEAYNNMGIAQYYKGDNYTAIASYRKALEIKPDYAAAYNNMGIAYKKTGDYDAAIASYKNALELKPDDADAYIKMGHAQSAKGDYDEAIASYQNALQLKPDNAVTYSNMGYAQEMKGDYDAAIASCQKALKLNPDLDSAYNNMGYAQNKKGDYDGAIASCKKALELNPLLANPYNHMGVAQKNKGEFDSAIASFQKALEIKPSYLSPKMNLSELYLTTERFDKAMELAHQVLKEKDVPLYDILAMKSIVVSSLFFQGNRSQALMELQQLIKVYRGLTKDLKRNWDYSPTKKFITQTQRLSEPTQSLLLKLIELLKTTKEEGDKILVELEKMVQEYNK